MRMAALFAAFAMLGAAGASAQAPPEGYIGIYADTNRASNDVWYAGGITEFTIYIMVQPSERGLMCAEFAVEYPPNVAFDSAWANPILGGSLGSLADGVSACFRTCRFDWAWTHAQTIYVLTPEPADIRIVPHPGTGAIQVATCEQGFPIEEAYASASICVNHPCGTDTIPPVLLGAAATNLLAVEAAFDEAVFKASAENVGNYLMHRISPPGEDVAIVSAVRTLNGASVLLTMGEQLVLGSTYTLEVSGVQDLHGNPVAAGSTATFAAADDTPPTPVAAWAIADSVVLIRFSEPLDEGSAETPANYSVVRISTGASTAVAAAELDPGRKIVMLALGGHLVDGALYRVLVSGVEDLAGTPVEPGSYASFTEPFYGPPYIVSARPILADLAEIVFSEAMDAASTTDRANYRIFSAGSPEDTIGILGVALYEGVAGYSLRLAEPLVEGSTYTIAVSCVMDAGLTPIAPGSEISLFFDIDPPKLLGGVVPADTLIDLSFDEKLDPPSVEERTHYFVSRIGTPPVSVTVQAAFLIEDGTKARIVLGTRLEAGRSYSVNVLGIKDVYGNVITRLAGTTVVYPDTVPPHIAGIRGVANDEIEVTFSEQMAAEGFATIANYSLVRAASPGDTIEIAEVARGASNAVALLRCGSDLEHLAIHRLTVSNLEDLYGNAIAPGSFDEFIFVDTFVPAVLSIEVPSDTIVDIAFDELMDPASAGDAVRYAVLAAGDPYHPYTAVAATMLADSATVRLRLDRPLAINAAYRLFISAVADRAGNAIPYGTEYAFEYLDVIPPSVTGVVAVASDTIDVLFDEEIAPVGASNPANFSLRPSADPADSIIVSSAARSPGGEGARLALGEYLTHGRRYAVGVKGIADSRGNAVDPPISVDFTFQDAFPPRLAGAAAPSDSTILLTFDERLDSATASAPELYSVRERLNPSIVIAVNGASVADGSIAVELSLGGKLQAGVPYIVATCGVPDSLGNSGGPGACDEAVAVSVESEPPTIAQIHSISAVSVAVTFSEAVDRATAEIPGNYVLHRGVPPSATIGTAGAVLQDDWRTVKLTFAAPLTAWNTYYLVVSGVEDFSGNPIAAGSTVSFVHTPLPAAGKIGLFVDANHMGTEVYCSGVPTMFTLYVWCLPGQWGQIGADFAILFPANVIPGELTMNEELLGAVSGDPASGMSVSLDDCRYEWLWPCRQVCWLTDAARTVVGLVPHPGVGAVRFRECRTGFPAVEAQVLTHVYMNGSYTPGTLLQSHFARWGENGVEIGWTLLEVDPDARFIVSRAEGGTEEFTEIDAASLDRDGLTFIFVDRTARRGTAYRYRVELEDAASRRVLFETAVDPVPALPLALHQNVPNPFNPTTKLRYYLPSASRVVLDLFDIAGRRVARLIDERQDAGEHSIEWSGLDDSGRPAVSGVYLVRLAADREVVSGKIVLLR